MTSVEDAIENFLIISFIRSPFSHFIFVETPFKLNITSAINEIILKIRQYLGEFEYDLKILYDIIKEIKLSYNNYNALQNSLNKEENEQEQNQISKDSKNEIDNMKILEFRDQLSESISKVIGAPGNQISLIITMLSAIPFCLLNYFIHGKNIRLIYSLVLGFLFQLSIYKFNSIHIFVSSIGTYLFIQYFGRKYSAFYVLVFSFIYLSYLHIHRMFFEYGEWSADDPTIIYMMSIAKFSSLAFSYEDGEIDPKLLKNNHHREYRIVEKPTLLEVLSFIYFYPTSIVGPSIEFKDFINFIKEEDCYSHLNENILFILGHGTFYFIASFLSMAYYSIISNKLPLEAEAEEDFGKNSLLYGLLYIKICIPAVRARYYSGWNLIQWLFFRACPIQKKLKKMVKK